MQELNYRIINHKIKLQKDKIQDLERMKKDLKKPSSILDEWIE